MCTQIILADDHPYMRHLDISVRPFGKWWMVRWRDFTSMKQDCEFDRYWDAVKFARRVRKDARKVDCYILEQIECSGFDFESMTAWWDEVS